MVTPTGAGLQTDLFGLAAGTSVLSALRVLQAITW